MFIIGFDDTIMNMCTSKFTKLYTLLYEVLNISNVGEDYCQDVMLKSSLYSAIPAAASFPALSQRASCRDMVSGPLNNRQSRARANQSTSKQHILLSTPSDASAWESESMAAGSCNETSEL